MKHWQETERILDLLLELADAGRAAALARVVHIEGSAYRHPGAKLLIAETATLGGVSGGCLEEDVRLIGLDVLRSGEPRLRHYDTDASDNQVWGLGLGCGGKVDVFIQPASTPEALGVWRAVRELLRGNAPFAVSTVVEGPGAGRILVAGEEGRLSGSLGDAALDEEGATGARAALAERKSRDSRARGRRIFHEVMLPPPRLLVCGAGDDAQPLVAYAAGVGFRVLVADHRSAYLTPERFPGAARLLAQRPEEGVPDAAAGPDSFAVVKTHSLRLDREWVSRLLRTDVKYIGLLGPRARAQRILEEIGGSGERVYGPVGLDLGAEGPEQVALAIVAELMAVRSGRGIRHLREKESAVHA